MAWMPHRLRDTDVWARVGADGALVIDKTGRVDVVYRTDPGAKIYRANARNLTRKEGPPIEVETAGGSATAPIPTTTPDDAIHVWTDGACSGNPGPAGIGVVVIDGDRRQEIGEFIGNATNQIAELRAIEHGLEAITDRSRPTLVYSDSAYAIGLLTKSWRAKANVELVARLRALTREFREIRFIKVLGHAGVPENERCDQLATTAVRMQARSAGTGEKLGITPNAPPRRGAERLQSASIGSADAPSRRK